MKWNPEQTSAIAGIVKFIQKPFKQTDLTGWAIVINGFAGTGKTTLVQEAIRQASDLNPDLRVCVSAPTNKATGVLKHFGVEAGVEVDSGTIFSLLGLVLGSEGETRSCFQGGEGNFDQYEVIVIDEASMVGTRLMDHIYDRAMKYGVKVVFMGDPNQLNPVRETASRVFNPVEVPDTYSLTQMMRQDEGSPIREVVHHCRVWAADRIVPPAFETNLTEGDDGVHVITGKDFYDTMLDQFDCEEYKTNPSFCRAIAWTNREVERLNRMIRHRIYGKKCEDFVVGETVCVLTPVLSDDGFPVIATDDECVIESIGTATLTDNADFDTLAEGHPAYKVWVLHLKLPEGGKHRVITLHRDSRADCAMREKRLVAKAHNKTGTWPAFYKFKEMFTVVRPAHATTAHKSQGQTFETIFYQGKDAAANNNPKERARLAYVATSRATTNLVINVKQFK